ncbi:unnamed protein product [Mytilus edulis]|uniref:C-type lectin domain-containing protein n=1 Tax=Mytilus edulis TaxID=6550 RepID=A0A8S3UNR7_MYTED|nr:unnamed protein product [Mytilus edulis]
MAMMAMTMMKSMSLTTAQAVPVQNAVEAVTAAAVACPTPKPPPATTKCVPSSCPEGYRLLDDQNVSPNCYMFSGTTKKNWFKALMTCTMTKGATLWVPNSEAEANAVRTTFSLPRDYRIWTWGLKDDYGNFVFAIDNSVFSFATLKFGTGESGPRGANCVTTRYLTYPLAWRWIDRNCKDDELFVCELPRPVSPEYKILPWMHYFFVARVDKIWTGGNDLKDDNGNFVFAIDNSEFSFDNLEFGTGNFDFII